MPQLTDILFWTSQLGHLPVHLESTVDDKYIMLNGVSGNFCLHFSNEPEESSTYFSQSWSSNTKNFLLVNESNVRLFNWHKDIKEENIPIAAVRDNIDKFYQYLLTKSYKSEKDIVPFVIDIFRQFRTYTGEAFNPVKALNLLFAMLASMEDENIDNLDREKWGISEFDLPAGFNSYIERFKQGVNNITPNLNLILRHSSGALFQEAQKEVLFFDSQIDLFGTFSGAMHTKELLYSSIHYTPSYLARSIVENALKSLNLDALPEIKIFDPACGSAEFLIEALKQLREKNYPGIVKISGYDSSQTAINTSTFLLTYEKRTIWNERLFFTIEKVEDSLMKEWENDYNLILMNPPFVSWEQLEEKSKKEAVREVLGTNFKGRPNQSSAFFYKAIIHLAQNGVLGSVIPTSVLSADYYQKLRHEVESIFSFELVAKLGNFVFEDALTDISIIVGRKPKEGTLPILLWTRNEKGVVHDALRELRKMQYSDGTPKNRIDFSIFKPSQFPIIQETWKPVSMKEHALIRNLKMHISAGKLSTVNEIFEVQQGIRTGNNDVFKISTIDYSRLPELEKKYFRPVTENESISNGKLETINYVWYPYNESGLLIKTEAEFDDNAPTFYRRLFPFKEVLSNRARKSVENWWQLSEHRAWQRLSEIKLISTEFGNSSSFAIDLRGNCVVERGYAWQPKKKFTNKDYYFYLALFSSPFFDKLLSIYSKELAGGKWYDLGKKSTKYIPIPNAHSEDIRKGEHYGTMVNLGKRLSEGNDYVKAVINDIVSVYYPSQNK